MRKRRYLFAETFGAIALAEYAAGDRVGGDAGAGAAVVPAAVDVLPHAGPAAAEVLPQTITLKSHAMPMIMVVTSQVMRQDDPGDPLYDDTINREIEACSATS